MRFFAISYSGILVGIGLSLGAINGLFGSHQAVVIGLVTLCSAMCLLLQLFENPLTSRSVACFCAFGAFAIPMSISMVLADSRSVHIQDWGRAVLQVVLLWTWICFCLGSEWNSEWLWRIATAIVFVIVAWSLMEWSRSGFASRFQGMSVAKNSLGATAMNGVFIGCGGAWISRAAVWRAFSVVVAMSSLLLLYASSNRSTIASVCLALALCSMWPVISRSGLRMAALLCCLIVVSALIPKAYISFENWRSFDTLNRISEEYFDMRIMSGRDAVWPAVIEAVGQQPVFGHGASVEAMFERKLSDGKREALSTHNLYMSIMLRSGFVGLMGFIVCIACLWRQYYLCSDWWLARWSFGFFVAILLRANFDVTLTHTGLQVGLGEWTIIASGISASYENRLGRVARDQW